MTRHVYHLVEHNDTRKVVCVFQSGSVDEAIRTADILDPPSQYLMLHQDPKILGIRYEWAGDP